MWGGWHSPVPREACGDRCAVVFQYKVLSVLPGTGMGIAVSTPSTQKVSPGQAGSQGDGGVGPGLGLWASWGELRAADWRGFRWVEVPPWQQEPTAVLGMHLGG